MLQARKLSLRYEKQKQLDLTERAFSPQRQVDTSQSVCRQDKATYVAHTCLDVSCALTLRWYLFL